MENILIIYQNYIYDRYNSLLKSDKLDFDNNDLCKIFEYYTAIKLYEKYGNLFYEYNDIDPNFKELNNMSKNDSGIDLCDLKNTIVQCKLRSKYLNWKECSTFFASQNIFSEEENKVIIKWINLLIARNDDCSLSSNLLIKKDKLFTDIQFNKQELIYYCDELIKNPPLMPILEKENIKLRDYQIECIELIKNTDKNIIIQLPTGCGKNVIIKNYISYCIDIANSKIGIENGKNTKSLKFLILVPKIILMEQIRDEFVGLNLLDSIQIIGDGNTEFNGNKLITICVYNSIDKIDNFAQFEKIFIDEAHHIIKPEIYYNEDDTNSEYNSEYDSDEDYPLDIDENEEDYLSDEDEYNSEHEDIEEDEFDMEENYLTKIRKLKKYNNNVFLSATIDKIDEYEYYSKDIRDMINDGYLCDYNIHIPIFSGSFDAIKNDINVCKHLIQNYRNIIIYCNTKEEGIEINRIMNDLLPLCSNYVDCDTKRNERKTILEKFKSGEVSFLVNVKILVEGVNFPITKGVCFLHMPSSKTAIIQIIGRALRLHDHKTIANIILPFSNTEDEKSINNFLRILANNDRRIKQSYDNKKLGGYISLDKVESEDLENLDSADNCEFRFTMIYNNIGKLINSEEIWMQKLEAVKKYIDEFEKRPNKESKNKEEKFMGLWLGTQIKTYKEKINIMKYENIRKLWDTFIDYYRQYFLSIEEVWKIRLEQITLYIDIHKKRPNKRSSNKEEKILGHWITNNLLSFKNKSNQMKTEVIYNLFTEFINKYSQYFMTNEEAWKINLEKCKKYIDENGERPNDGRYKNITVETKKLNTWLGEQLKNYKNNNKTMKNIEQYNLFTEFINKYKEYFVSNEENWKNKLEQVKEFIDKNNKKPNSEDNNDELSKSLGNWIQMTTSNYKNNKKNMKHVEMRQLWEEFINDIKYKVYLMSSREIWLYKLEQVKKYIEDNNKRPSAADKDKHLKDLGVWLSRQFKSYREKSYIMKTDQQIYNIWGEFINDEKYKKYILTNKEIWIDNLEKVKNYIDDNNKRPSSMSTNIEIKQLGKWIVSTTSNYSKKIGIMKDGENYRKLWEEFINDDKYKEYF